MVVFSASWPKKPLQCQLEGAHCSHQVPHPVPIRLVRVGAGAQVTPGNCLSDFRSNTFLNYYTHTPKKNLKYQNSHAESWLHQFELFRNTQEDMMLPRKSYNLFEVTISQGDERDDVTHLTNPWLPSTDLTVLIQGHFFKIYLPISNFISIIPKP